jgi:hypothetical protein
MLPGGIAAAMEGCAVKLPEQLVNGTFRDVPTGRLVCLHRGEMESLLDVGEVWRVLPLALLEADL